MKQRAWQLNIEKSANRMALQDYTYWKINKEKVVLKC